MIAEASGACFILRLEEFGFDGVVRQAKIPYQPILDNALLPDSEASQSINFVNFCVLSSSGPARQRLVSLSKCLGRSNIGIERPNGEVTSARRAGGMST
jgi:hypothetical protein